MSIATALRATPYRLRRLVRGGWGWITLRPGTRPRRMARRTAGSAIAFVLDRPALARAAQAVLRFTPTFKAHLRNLNPRSVTARELSRHGREIRAMLLRAERRRARRAG